MFVRRIVLVLVSSSLLAFASGCSSDATPETPSDTGTSKGKEKTSKSDQADQADDSDPSDPRDSRGGEDDDRSPPDEPKTPAKKKDGAQCAESADCESDFCIFQGNGLGMCTSTCDDDIDCALGHRCVKLSNAPQKACVPE